MCRSKALVFNNVGLHWVKPIKCLQPQTQTRDSVIEACAPTFTYEIFCPICSCNFYWLNKVYGSLRLGVPTVKRFSVENFRCPDYQV